MPLPFAAASQPHWPVELKERIARDAVERGALINSLRVEPELGSPSRGGLPATLGKRVTGHHADDGGYWLLNGRKLYSTGSPRLTWLAVWGRTDEPSPRVGTWLVHRDTPGVRVGEPWNHLGMRATGSHELIFDNVSNPGLSRNNPLERHYRDVLCARIHTPQNDTVLGALGRAAFAAH